MEERPFVNHMAMAILAARGYLARPSCKQSINTEEM